MSHEAWEVTTDETPIEERWGGWYVTGRHGTLRHMGNEVVLGDPALTAGIPGDGPLSVAQIQAWLDAPENHVPLKVELREGNPKHER